MTVTGSRFCARQSPDGALCLFLDDELVHAPEGVGILLLIGVPMIKIGAGGVVRELCAIPRRHGNFELESDEFKPVSGEKILDLGDRETVLLDVKQEVATIAGAIEIGSLDNGPFRRLIECKDVLSAAPDVVDRRLVAARGNEISRGNDVGPCEFTVQ